MKLIDIQTRRELAKGDKVKTFRGETVTLEDFREPRRPGTSGYVYVRYPGQRDTNEFYPSVIQAMFVKGE